jgi:hypothetical protein
MKTGNHSGVFPFIERILNRKKGANLTNFLRFPMIPQRCRKRLEGMGRLSA